MRTNQLRFTRDERAIVARFLATPPARTVDRRATARLNAGPFAMLPRCPR